MSLVRKKWGGLMAFGWRCRPGCTCGKHRRRKRSQGMRERDARIVELRRRGLTFQEIADRYGVTYQRIQQIVGRGG